MTSAPWRAASVETSCAVWPMHHVLGRSVSVDVLDVAQAARHRHHVDRGVAAADHHHAAGDRLQAPLVEGLEERDAADAVGGVGPRRPAACARPCSRWRAAPRRSLVSRSLSATSLPMRVLSRTSTPMSTMRLISPFSVLARQAIARHAVLRHAAELVVIVEHGDAHDPCGAAGRRPRGQPGRRR